MIHPISYEIIGSIFLFVPLPEVRPYVKIVFHAILKSQAIWDKYVAQSKKKVLITQNRFGKSSLSKVQNYMYYNSVIYTCMYPTISGM